MSKIIYIGGSYNGHGDSSYSSNTVSISGLSNNAGSSLTPASVSEQIASGWQGVSDRAAAMYTPQPITPLYTPTYTYTPPSVAENWQSAFSINNPAPFVPQTSFVYNSNGTMSNQAQGTSNNTTIFGLPKGKGGLWKNLGKKPSSQPQEAKVQAAHQAYKKMTPRPAKPKIPESVKRQVFAKYKAPGQLHLSNIKGSHATQRGVNKAVGDVIHYGRWLPEAECVDINAYTNLRVLKLDNTNTSDEDIKQFILHMGHRNLNLTSLSFANNNIGDTGFFDFCFHAPDLKYSKDITIFNIGQIDFSNNKISDEGAKKIADAIKTGKVTKLAHLNLAGNRISQTGQSYIVDAIKEAKSMLSVVFLKSGQLSLPTAHDLHEPLFVLHRAPNTLDFTGVTGQSDYNTHYSKAVGDLLHYKRPHEAAAYTSDINAFANTKEIRLDNANLTDKDMWDLMIGIKSSNLDLDRLSLAGNGFGDRGLHNFTFTMLHQKRNEDVDYFNIKEIDLSNNRFGNDSTISYLVTNIKRENYGDLRVLNLSGNNINDNGAKYFADIIKRKKTNNLQEINFTGNKITPKGRKLIDDAIGVTNSNIVVTYSDIWNAVNPNNHLNLGSNYVTEGISKGALHSSMLISTASEIGITPVQLASNPNAYKTSVDVLNLDFTVTALKKYADSSDGVIGELANRVSQELVTTRNSVISGGPKFSSIWEKTKDNLLQGKTSMWNITPVGLDAIGNMLDYVKDSVGYTVSSNAPKTSAVFKSSLGYTVEKILQTGLEGAIEVYGEEDVRSVLKKLERGWDFAVQNSTEGQRTVIIDAAMFGAAAVASRAVIASKLGKASHLPSEYVIKLSKQEAHGIKALETNGLNDKFRNFTTASNWEKFADHVAHLETKLPNAHDMKTTYPKQDKTFGIRKAWNGNQHEIVIKKARTDSIHPSQQVHYVSVTSNGQTLAKDGSFIVKKSDGLYKELPKNSNPLSPDPSTGVKLPAIGGVDHPLKHPDAHIPLEEWIEWKEWYKP